MQYTTMPRTEFLDMLLKLFVAVVKDINKDLEKMS